MSESTEGLPAQTTATAAKPKRKRSTAAAKRPASKIKTKRPAASSARRPTKTKAAKRPAAGGSKRRLPRTEWTSKQVMEMRAMAQRKVPARDMAKKFGRTEGAVRQKAFSEHISLRTGKPRAKVAAARKTPSRKAARPAAKRNRPAAKKRA